MENSYLDIDMAFLAYAYARGEISGRVGHSFSSIYHNYTGGFCQLCRCHPPVQCLQTMAHLRHWAHRRSTEPASGLVPQYQCQLWSPWLLIDLPLGLWDRPWCEQVG